VANTDALPGENATPDDAALRRLRWRARRGLLENDLLIGRFLDRHGKTLDAAQNRALLKLLELPDTELLDLLLARTEPGPLLATDEVRALLARLRAV
jgi:antitoxin CptB